MVNPLAAPARNSFERQIIDANPFSTILVDARADDHPIVYVNETFTRDTGYTLAEVQGRNPRFLQGDDTDQPGLEIIRTALDSQTGCTATVRNYRKDGTLFYNEIRITPLYDANGELAYFLGVQDDVTERVQQREELARNEALFRMMTEESDDIIAVHKPDGTSIYSNPSVKRLLYLPPGTDPRTIIHPDYREKAAQLTLKVLNGASIAREELRYRRGDDTYLWVSAYAKPILDDDGNVVQILAVSRDISERKEAEQRLHETQRFLEAVVNTAPSFIYIYDVIENSNVYSNHALTKMLGYTPQELKAFGENAIPALIHPDDVQQVCDNIAMLDDPDYDNTQNWYLVYRIKHKDGSWRWLQDQGCIFNRTEDGRAREILGAMVDVTEAKWLEQALRESEAKYRSIFETMSDGVVVHASDGHITAANPAAASILRLSIDDIIGRTSHDAYWNAIYEDGSPFPGEQHPAMVTLRTGEPQTAVVMGLKVTDGVTETTWILINSRRLQYGLAAEGVVVTFSDITARKRHEQERLRLALEKERLRLLADFIRDAAHEFRTPLSTISTSAYMLLMSPHGDQRELAGRDIDDQIDHMRRLIDGMLKMVRLNSGQITLATVDLDSLVCQVHDMARTQYGPHVNLSIAEPLPTTLANANLLQEALLALINNAHRYAGEGTSPIVLAAQVVDATVEIAVKDTGPGIALEDQPYIFNTFWRSDKAHSTPGLGLGLPIAQRIAVLHNGALHFTSEEGVGSTFWLALPVVAQRSG